MLPAFTVLLVLGDIIFSFFFTLHDSFQVTSWGPPTRISLAIYSHCHPFYPPVRSVSCDSTCTILDTVRHRHGKTKKEGQRAKTSRQQRNGATRQGRTGHLGALWRCILTTAFLFPSLFFYDKHTLSLFSLLTLFTRRYSWVAAVDDCRLLGSHGRSGSSIQTHKGKLPAPHNGNVR